MPPRACNYRTCVYCTPTPYDPFILTVDGIDLNHVAKAGCLPEELGLLMTLLSHINSDRCFGIIPDSFAHLKSLYEIDIN